MLSAGGGSQLLLLSYRCFLCLVLYDLRPLPLLLPLPLPLACLWLLCVGVCCRRLLRSLMARAAVAMAMFRLHPCVLACSMIAAINVGSSVMGLVSVAFVFAKITVDMCSIVHGFVGEAVGLFKSTAVSLVVRSSWYWDISCWKFLCALKLSMSSAE